MSEDLFPTRFKKNPNATYVICKLCGKEVEEHVTKDGICKTCLNGGEYYQCKRCGKDLVFTNYQKYIKHANRFDLCPECFAWGNETYTNCICSDCQTYFSITNNEYNYFMSKGLALPRRCKVCRKNKNARGW